MISYRPPVFPNVSDNKKNGTQVSLPHQRGTRTAVCSQYGTKSKTKIARVRQISPITPKTFLQQQHFTAYKSAQQPQCHNYSNKMLQLFKQNATALKTQRFSTTNTTVLHNKPDGTPHKNHPHRRKFYITQCVLYIMQCVLYIMQCVLYITQCVIHIMQCIINFFPQFPQFPDPLKTGLLCSGENKRRNANLDSRGMRSAIYVLIVCFEKSSKGERMPHAGIGHTHCFSSPASSIIARGL